MTATLKRLRGMPPAPEGVTLWRRIADELAHMIVTGSLATGDKLPGEVEIAGRFGVNRHTVRRALAELTTRGLVRAERGSGTFVGPARLSYPIGARTRFSEIVGAAGREAGGRLVAHAREPASAELAARLEVEEGAELTRLDVIRSADGVPICRSANWVSTARMPDAVRIYRRTQSMTKTLAHFGVRDYRRRQTRIGSALADAVDAERLHIAMGRPLLIVESINTTSAGEPVLTTVARFAADRVEILVES